jgi:regulatory protein
MSGRRGGGAKGPPLPRGTAKDRALRLLGVRWRSREELRRRLAAAGFEPEAIESALRELEDVGLIDDTRFAREVVSDRAVRRLSGDRAIRTTLRQRGVTAEVAEQALEGAGDEVERARALALLKAPRLATVEPEAAYRRLFGLLVRRGFGPGLARDASREALRRVSSPDSVPDEDA